MFEGSPNTENVTKFWKIETCSNSKVDEESSEHSEWHWLLLWKKIHFRTKFLRNMEIELSENIEVWCKLVSAFLMVNIWVGLDSQPPFIQRRQEQDGCRCFTKSMQPPELSTSSILLMLWEGLLLLLSGDDILLASHYIFQVDAWINLGLQTSRSKCKGRRCYYFLFK